MGCYRCNHSWRYKTERWCGYSERMYPRYITSYHGIKQSDPSRNLCLLAESIYRCDHYHWYCNLRNASHNVKIGKAKTGKKEAA